MSWRHGTSRRASQAVCKAKNGPLLGARRPRQGVAIIYYDVKHDWPLTCQGCDRASRLGWPRCPSTAACYSSAGTKTPASARSLLASPRSSVIWSPARRALPGLPSRSCSSPLVMLRRHSGPGSSPCSSLCSARRSRCFSAFCEPESRWRRWLHSRSAIHTGETTLCIEQRLQRHSFRCFLQGVVKSNRGLEHCEFFQHLWGPNT